MKRRTLPEVVHSSNYNLEPESESRDHSSLSRHGRFVGTILGWTVAVLSVAIFVWFLIPDESIEIFQGKNVLLKTYLSHSLEVADSAVPVRMVATASFPFQVLRDGEPLFDASRSSEWIGNTVLYIVSTEIVNSSRISLNYEIVEGEESVQVELTSADIIDVTVTRDKRSGKLIIITLVAFLVWFLVGLVMFLNHLHSQLSS